MPSPGFLTKLSGYILTQLVNREPNIEAKQKCILSYLFLHEEYRLYTVQYICYKIRHWITSVTTVTLHLAYRIQQAKSVLYIFLFGIKSYASQNNNIQKVQFFSLLDNAAGYYHKNNDSHKYITYKSVNFLYHRIVSSSLGTLMAITV